jgi:hypothetical protein
MGIASLAIFSQKAQPVDRRTVKEQADNYFQ